MFDGGLVIQALPGSPGGIGIGEAGFGGLYELFGCTFGIAVIGSLVRRVIDWTIGLGGYLIWLRMKSTQPAASGPEGCFVRSAREPDTVAAVEN